MTEMDMVYCLFVQFFALNIDGASLGAFMRNLRHQPSTSTLSLAEWPSYNIIEPNGPGTYAFGYEIEDDSTKNIQFRDEEKLSNGTVLGSYGLVRPNGEIALTHYIADENGYRTQAHNVNPIESKPFIHTSTQPPHIVPVGTNDVDYLDNTITPQTDTEKLNTRLNKTISPIMKIDKNDFYQKQHNTGNRYQYGNTNNKYHNYPYDHNNDENDSNEQSHSLGDTNISEEYPIKFKAGENLTFGLQLINNFIPHTYQVVPLYFDRNYQEKETPAQYISHDEILPEEQQVNDKFFDPVYNEKSTDIKNRYNINNFKISKTNLKKPKSDLVKRFQKEKIKLLRVHGSLF